jgi:Protein kinase domain/Bacterial Ig-like domain (group 2)
VTIPEGRLTRLLREALSPDDAKGSSWDSALFPGAVVGRFEMIRELGRGGFGTVWEARDTALKRRVAFKAIRGAGRGAADDRALAEAEAAAHLLHPNVVTLFDLGRSEHGAFLVMELLEGRSLAAALQEGPFPPAEARRIGAGIAAGLAHAHAKGVLHRDLTPSNVFLCANGDVKLLDLGLSRVLGRDGSHVGPGDGTPGHAPPERLRGEPEDARGDLYALGLLLQLMLTGALPDEVRRPGAIGVRVPGWDGLDTLVARLLDDDPGRRPAAAREVLQELDRMGERAEAQGRKGDGRPAVPPASRRPSLGGAAIVALLLLVAAAIGGAMSGRGSGRGAALDVRLATAVLAPGQVTQATVRRAGGGDVEGSVVWTVSEPAVALVNGAGVVRARRDGTTTLVATTGDGQGSATVLVTGPEWRFAGSPGLDPPPPGAKQLPEDRRDVQRAAQVQGRRAWVQSGEEASLFVPVDLTGDGDLYALQVEVLRESTRGAAAEIHFGLASRVGGAGGLRAEVPGSGRWQTLRVEGSRRRCSSSLLRDGVMVDQTSGLCFVGTRHGVVLSAEPNGSPVAWSNLLVFEGTPAAGVAVAVQVLPAGGPAYARAVATVTDADGHPLPGRTIAWESSDPAIASVDGEGRVFAHARGRVTITARCEGKSDTELLEIPAPAARD